MHIFLVTYNIMKRKVDTYGRKEKQSFDEEFAPEISPGYRQDVHKQPKYKNTSFLMGITILPLYCLCLSFSFIFDGR